MELIFQFTIILGTCAGLLYLYCITGELGRVADALEMPHPAPPPEKNRVHP